MNRIGVFGGSFDPPHLAHYRVASAALQQCSLDRVIWIPAAVSPLKQEERPVSASDRVRMVELLIRDEPRFDVNTIEIDRGGVSYTVDTLRTLRSRFTDVDWFLILGADSLNGFDRWREPEAIGALATLLVYGRPGARLPEPALGIQILDGTDMDISSTGVRSELAAGHRPEEDVLPARLTEYIRTHGLYL